jgi:hypothetical protein
MERTISDTDIMISNLARERLLRRLNESEDKTHHFIHEGASVPFGITLSTFLSKEGKGVEVPAHKQSVPLSS